MPGRAAACRMAARSPGLARAPPSMSTVLDRPSAPPASATPPGTGPRAPVAAAPLFTVLLDRTDPDEAATAWLQAVCQVLQARQAVLAWVEGAELQLAVCAHGRAAALPADEAARWRLALGEAFDQQAVLAWPDARAQAAAPVRIAQRQLLQERDGGVASLPLPSRDGPIAVLSLWREGQPLLASELAALQREARIAGPILRLLRRDAWSLGQRMRLSLRGAASTAGGSGSADNGNGAGVAAGLASRRRWGGRSSALAAAALLALALIPQPWRIGGHARLEGAVQRVLSAPSDGFLQQVHARPGQAVRAGELLLELARDDLLLEQQRWRSQLEQYENAQAAANARADRAQEVVQRARAAEAEAQLALIDARLARSRIVAPFDGVVLQGDLAASLGTPVSLGQELMTLAPEGAQRVVIEVDERDIAALAPGQTGRLALTALPWDSLPLEVVRIAPLARALDGRNVYEVEARLTASDPRLRPGLEGQARIEAGQRPWLAGATQRLRDAARRLWWGWFGG